MKERAEMNPKEVNTFVVNIRNLIYKIYNLSIPVIASIDGVALGKITKYLMFIELCEIFRILSTINFRWWLGDGTSFRY